MQAADLNDKIGACIDSIGKCNGVKECMANACGLPALEDTVASGT